jgi:hypothetical protein
MGNHGRTVLTLVLGFSLNWQLTTNAADLPGAGGPPTTTTTASPSEKRTNRSATVIIRDVALDVNGRLSGRIVDVQGRPVAGETVIAHQGRRQLGMTRSDEQGVFNFSASQGGVYQVSSRTGTAFYRVWKHGTAPKNAVRSALIIADASVVRGQAFEGLGSSLTTIGIGAAVITGATFAIVEWSNGDSKRQSPAQGAMSDSQFGQTNILSFSGGNLDLVPGSN